MARATQRFHVSDLPPPEPRTAQSNIAKMDDHELAELQIESQAVVGELLKTHMTSEKCVDAFMTWVLPQWTAFWGRFQPDGTMSWKEFEQFTRYDQQWKGDSRRLFGIFDPGSTGFITKQFVMQVRRKLNDQKDTAYHSIDHFKFKFSNRFGSLGRGWRLALDPGDSGHCPELPFMRCCHSIGMNRCLKSLWRRLTKGEVSRSLRLRDLDPELDRILADFAQRLVACHSTLRQGWCAVCRVGGGHLHEQGFEQSCRGLGIDARSSKMLFAVLDPKKRRYLTEYDNLDFLGIWDPGRQAGMAEDAETIAARLSDASKIPATGSNRGRGLSSSMPASGLQDESSMMPNLGYFEFELVLTKEEYSEYLRRRRAARIKSGLQGQKVDVGGETRRKAPIGGHKPRPPSAPPRLSRSHSSRSATSLTQAANSQVDLWHALAPNTLGAGNESLANTAQVLSSRGGASSLGRLLSCPATTG